jgi:glucose/arabinose dehydrogenase
LRRFSRRVAACVALVIAAALSGTSASAQSLPPGFQETTAFAGLNSPTAVRFAPDGRVFVAEKTGVVKTFDGLGDSTPTVFADLRTQVHNYWDRGLLGLELSPNWAAQPSVYVLYTRDAESGGPAPRWGTPGADSDSCPILNEGGCVVSGRLSRLVASGDGMVTEIPLIDDWCQQYLTHSIGALETDAAGRLYASGGDGAAQDFADYGQTGNPKNPCGDPPVGVGGTQTPPSAQGGALRSQDLRTNADPTGLSGSVIRIDPQTGAGVGSNPLAASSDPNARRVIAYGFRNPFRFEVASDGELWIGDVGWGDWEEINRGGSSGLANFGWPCYEGNGRQPGYDAIDLSICETLYGSPGAVTAPFFAYNHTAKVVPGESCAAGGSSISGLALYEAGDSFPANYDDALFFADAVRNCIWVMRAGAGGQPDPATVATFDAGASWPVDLEVGPDGALYYTDVALGRIQRIQYIGANQAPVAVADADPASGPASLSVSFSGAESFDPDGDPLAYAWDLDGDGEYDDSATESLTHVYSEPGTYSAGLRVSDDKDATGTATVAIDVGNTRPTATILSPSSALRWRVGQQVSFAGTATDAEDGPLPASALDWELIMHHCPSNCHEHSIQDYPNTEGGSFAAPNHEYPAHLELRLTATDSGGLQNSASVRLDPRTVNITLASNPSGFPLTLNGATKAVPFTTTLIEGSTNTISAPSPQKKGSWWYQWRSWSDAGARTHNVTAQTNASYTARFVLDLIR